MATTTIQIEDEVRDELRARGRMGETYNEVIRRLLDATRIKEEGLMDHARGPPVSTPNPLYSRQGMK
jgi:predicted CopG family antitoxin